MHLGKLALHLSHQKIYYTNLTAVRSPPSIPAKRPKIPHPSPKQRRRQPLATVPSPRWWRKRLRRVRLHEIPNNGF